MTVVLPLYFLFLFQGTFLYLLWSFAAQPSNGNSAIAAAILFLILNIIGFGLGPWSVGMLSDYLNPSLGAESLRYAMVYLVPTVLFWSSCHFYLAARTLREDLAAAPD